jgi:hypothetical protein
VAQQADGNEVPVSVFNGETTEALFLKSLLESSGIETHLQDSFFGPVRQLFVRRRDAKQAMEMLEDFRERNKQAR